MCPKNKQKRYSALVEAMSGEDYTHEAGLAFERHVIGLFGKDFKIRWMREGATKEEVDFSPDLEVEHIETGDVFGVECKYRASHFMGRLPWAKEYQLKKYSRYREKTGRLLFIVIGLGGTPERPDYMYCVPAWEAKATMLDVDGIKRHRRSPLRRFRWDSREKRLV
ncbi:hypothetical protein [Methanocella conradii]|uniref:hypothetical protein n=1 Tax=Methanocella conradii TaxID=1175444 RepID=UPI0024B394F3|nr:hypothetical protein [Methanocella conradii]MDI6896855.1 hypothetical protein [Methanocella conradii]